MSLRFVIGIFVICFLFSCKKNQKKDHVCECSGGSYFPNSTTIYHDTKENAERLCGSEPRVAVYDPGFTCSIK